MKTQSMIQKFATGLLALCLFASGASINRRLAQATTLVADEPAIVYSTFLGAISDDYIHDIAVDSTGNLYVAGYTYNKNLGGVPNPVKGYTDAFVAKLNPTGATLQWITYLGGNKSEQGYALAVSDTAVWLTGYTDSPDFPTTANAFDRDFGGYYDVLLARLDLATGAVNYSTYMGFEMQDEGRDIAMDRQGNVYVTGLNNSANVLAVKVTGETDPKVVYSLQWGDDRGQDIGNSIAVDAAGNAYITGMTENTPSGSTFPIKEGAVQSVCGPYVYENGTSECSADAFLSILNAAGDELLYSSLLGGGGGGAAELGSGRDEGQGITLDAQGNIYLTGLTYAADFPTVNAAYPNYPDAANLGDAWAMKLTPDGKTILYSTYLGGDSDDEGQQVVTDAAGNAYVMSWSRSSDFPTLKALQSNLGQGGICFAGSTVRACYDNTLTKLSPSGAVVWSTYVGGGFDEFGYGLTSDQAGNVIMVGSTKSPDYSTTAGAVQEEWGGNKDGFITKIGEGEASVTPTPVTPTPVTPSPVTPTPVPQGNEQIFLPLVQG